MVFGFLRTPHTAPPLRPRERVHSVAGREMPLRIVENVRARRLTLRIEANGRGLRVTVPPGVPEHEIDGFVERHRGWLEKKLEKLPDRPDVRPGIKIPVLGVPHLVVHVARTRGTVSLRDGESGPEMIVHGDARFLKRRLADYLKRRARAEIEPLVTKHTAAIRKKAVSVRFRDTTSRWGSCTSDGRLSFSWRIIMAPKPVVDYLVAHEVAHLCEMNHGPKFWKLCRELCPRSEEAKAWLKKNGSALQAIGF